MKNNSSGNAYNTENTYAASHKYYLPKTDGNSSENWFAAHKKLLWGIGGALVLGAGAFLYFKNKNVSDKYSDSYDEMNDLNQNEMNDLNQHVMDDLVKEDIIVTTITEFE
ncbi:MAG: LPXTG cell wall anchor domain-containing protein [Ginsengibacter sp.]